jgi:epsilon-lactone hydrolase
MSVKWLAGLSCSVAAMGLLALPAVARAQKAAVLDADGVYQLPAFSIPPSDLSSEQYKSKLKEQGRKAADARAAGTPQPALDLSTVEDILKVRETADNARKKIAEEMQETFPVTITREFIGGVETDVVMPKSGVLTKNKKRVLINLHGGGMLFGARWEGLVASIPIASLGGMKVITVDYRMAPEHKFPAASEDVAKVYEALLKQYKPKNVGIYGHSAGAGLTGQSVAWFQAHDLPTPGAIGLDGGSLAPGGGDSMYLAGAFLFGIPEYPPKGPSKVANLGMYMQGADFNSAVAAPGRHPEVLAKFPPTLISNSTRDPSMSNAVYTHSALIRLGVEADLHIWEGMPHSFHYDHTLPESRQSYDVLIKFFDKHLGK